MILKYELNIELYYIAIILFCSLFTFCLWFVIR